jgi:transglutaminase-like putative cysteine protease
MTKFNVGCDLTYNVRKLTVFLFQITAADTDHQKIISEKLTFDPELDVESSEVGLEGNQLHRVVVDPCELQIAYRASVELIPEIDRSLDVNELTVSQIPADVLTYMNPSRYCESDLLGRFAFEEFGQLERGFSRVRAICDWVNEHLEYTPGSTSSTTTAADVLLQRTGVCRDFAHLAIALCRGIGIPARYVAGYAVDLQPPDFHGFMEAFLDGQWYLFDPTRLAPTHKLIRIGVGSDAADVSFATLTGEATMTNKKVWANAIDGAKAKQIGGESTAVSTA